MASARRIRFERDEFPLRNSKYGASGAAGRAKAPAEARAKRARSLLREPIFIMKLRSVDVRIAFDGRGLMRGKDENCQTFYIYDGNYHRLVDDRQI